MEDKQDHKVIDMQTLNAKNCLLTGATGGLGKELAAKLVINGCNLFLTARNEKKLNKLTSLLQKQTENKIKIYYKSAGVNIDAGNEAVDRIKDKVESTFTPNVISGFGSFGSLSKHRFAKSIIFESLIDPLG